MAGKLWTAEELAVAIDPAVNTHAKWRVRLPGNTRTHEAVAHQRQRLESEATARGEKVALPFFSYDGMRGLNSSNALRRQQGKPLIEVPGTVRPRYDQPLEIPLEGGIVIFPDVHIPYQDGEFMTKVLNLAVSWKIQYGLLAGDYMNLDAFSRFITDEGEAREAFKEEIEAADDVLRVLLGPLKRMFWLRGNHERRITMQSAGQLGMWTLERLMHEPSKLQVTDKQWALVVPGGDEPPYRVTHPNRGRKNPTSWAREQATIKHQHIILAHSHQVAMTRDTSGKFWCIDSGCIADPRRLSYVWKEDKSLPDPQQGAVIIKRGKGGQSHPYLLTPDSDWAALQGLYP